MLVDDLTVEVRDSSLARVGQILASDLVGSEFVPRYNNVGAWKIVLRASHPLADSLRAPGSGIIVTLSDGRVLLSGPTRSATITKTSSDPSGIWEIIGVDDSIILGQRLAYPDPSTADVTAQAADYDIRTDLAETVLKEYVDANIGPSAPVDRKIPALTIEPDLGRGSTVTGKARFDRLGELLSVLSITSGLGFTVDQDGADLVFRVYEPTDRSLSIRMDIDNNRLTKSEYSYTTPTATRVIVAGQGTGVDRTFVEVSTVESESAEDDWASRIEVFKDQRNTNDLTELAQAGEEILADGGFTVRSVSVSPSDDQTMRYGEDWGLGDRVTVVVGSDEIAQVVTEVAVIVTDSGVKVGATVGDPKVASVNDTESALAVSSASQESRISNLERNEPSSSSPSGGSANVVQHLVKNDSGSTMPIGTVVYVTGANGTNILVGRADADTEATSSKTIGLLAQELVANGIGYVVTEGLLAGLDTSGATAGDSVWLSQTAGGFVYDNPPATPAHSVYLGVVTRSNNNNGEIFVHVQNGFELEELHDVLITSVASGNIIRRNTANTFWENVPGSTAGLAPTGSIIMFGSATPPAGWLVCNGQATTAGSALRALVGNNVPDLRNRFIIGAGSTYGQGAIGGSTSHSHTLSDAGQAKVRRSNNRLSLGEVSTVGWSPNQEVSGTGSGGTGGPFGSGVGLLGSTDNNTTFLPPYYALTYIIKT
jgi:hypothetical protein